MAVYLYSTQWAIIFKKHYKSKITHKSLRAGCNVNQQINHGETPLLQAVEDTHITAIQGVIAHRADVNIYVNDNYTPLDLLAIDNKQMNV